MNVRNCKKCGKLFNYALGPIICPQCKELLDEKFKEVKKYIQDHPMVGIAEVSRECEIETGQIQQWIREERLEFTNDSMVTLNCESCGAPIRSGRYCDKCKNELATGFARAVARPQAAPAPAPKDTKTSAKMRFLN